MAGCRLWGMAQQERRSAGSDAADLADWLEQTLLHAGVITTCHLLAGGVNTKKPCQGQGWIALWRWFTADRCFRKQSSQTQWPG